MINLFIVRSEAEVRMMYYREEQEDMRKEKDHNIKRVLYFSLSTRPEIRERG